MEKIIVLMFSPAFSTLSECLILYSYKWLAKL